MEYEQEPEATFAWGGSHDTRAMRCRCDANALLSLALSAKFARSNALGKVFLVLLKRF
jgi:hypothetical protein